MGKQNAIPSQNSEATTPSGAHADSKLRRSVVFKSSESIVGLGKYITLENNAEAVRSFSADLKLLRVSMTLAF